MQPYEHVGKGETQSDKLGVITYFFQLAVGTQLPKSHLSLLPDSSCETHWGDLCVFSSSAAGFYE